MHDDTTNNPPAKDGRGFEILSDARRVENRPMVTEGQSVTAEIGRAIMSRLEAWRKNNPNPNNPSKLLSWKKIAEEISGDGSTISDSTLSELRGGKYAGDADSMLRRIAAWLDDQDSKAGRVEFARHAQIDLVRKLQGVYESAVKYNRMAAVIGQPGWGKTNFQLAFQRSRPGTTYIRMLKPDSSDRDVSDLVCGAIPDLQPNRARPHRQRVNDIIGWLQGHRNSVWLVDEGQHNGRSGWEMWRTFHDAADPSQQRGLPIIFTGDETLERAIVQSKGGVKTAVAPQLARRFLFVFNIDRQGAGDDDDGGDVLSVEDICKIVQGGKLRIVTPDAARWLMRLANTPHGGHLGQTLDTLRVAVDIAGRLGAKLVDVEHLQMALEMNNGKALAKAIDAASGGELLRRTA